MTAASTAAPLWDKANVAAVVLMVVFAMFAVWMQDVKPQLGCACERTQGICHCKMR